MQNPANSTSTALAAGATFTGIWSDVAEYGSVIVSCKTDQAGTLYIEFSPDASNVDSSLSYSVAANTNEVHRLSISKKFFRARFTNTSASPQSFIRLQTVFGFQPNLTSNLNTVVQQDADSLIVRAIDAEIDIAAGRYSGFSIVNKYGLNPDVDTGTVPEDIWESGGVYTGFPTGAAETVSILSSSVNDAAAGTGARAVTIFGLDANYALQSETLTLNGTTPVDSVNTYMRVHSAFVATSGSSNQAFNDGNITIRHTTTTANVFLFMLAGRNQTNCSAYTVPAGKTAYLREVNGSVRGAATASADCTVWVRPFGSSPRLRRPFTLDSGSQLHDTIYGGTPLTEKTDIILRATSVSANNTELVSGYDLLLVDN